MAPWTAGFSCNKYMPFFTDRIVCYFANWSVYRRGAGKFEVTNIDPTLCTHYVYAFAGLSANGEILVTDEAVDITGGMLNIRT